MTHFLATHLEWVLLVVLVWGAAGLIIRHEIRNAVLVDATGRPICPVDQAYEDAREITTGHRDHERPGGEL